MALVDRCIFTAAGAGMADFTVAGAVLGYQTPLQAGAIDGDTYSYAAQSSDLTQWEVGISTYIAPSTVQRSTVLFNSSGGTSAINFTRAPQVLLTALAEDFASLGPFTATAYNANQFNDSNAATAFTFLASTDGTNVQPGFPDDIAQYIEFGVIHGENLTNSISGNKKTTFFASLAQCNYYGSGQRNSFGLGVTDYGTGDCFAASTSVFFAGCNVGSDEGKGFHSIGHLGQIGNLAIPTITGVGTPSAVNATITPAITASLNVQTVAITGTPPAIGDWVVVDQPTELAPGLSNAEAVQVTAATPTSFSGIFRNDHQAAAGVLPATVISIDNAGLGIGEDRYFVNLSKPSITAGTISGISGSTVTGNGTNWTTGMVSGNVHNIGVIAFTADQVTAAPFDGGNTLNSYYPISGVNSTTSLNISLLYNFGSQNYRGNSGGGDTYAIHQAVKILWIAPGYTGTNLQGGQQVICGYSASTWSVNDNIEVAFGPNPTVSPFSYQAQIFTPGAFLSAFHGVSNTGLIQFRQGYFVDGTQTLDGSTGFQVGFAAFGCGALAVGSNNPADSYDGFGYGNTFLHFTQSDGNTANLDVYTAGADGGLVINSISSGGTFGTPTATQSGVGLGVFAAAGYTSSYTSETGGLHIAAAQNFSVGNHGTELDFFVTPVGSSSIFIGAKANDYGGLGYVSRAFAALPSPPAITGFVPLVIINDSTVNTAGASITVGSGGHVVWAYSNGTNWKVLFAIT